MIELPADDAAEVLHAAVVKQIERYGDAWPSDVERLVYAQLHTAVELFLAYLDEIDREAMA